MTKCVRVSKRCQRTLLVFAATLLVLNLSLSAASEACTKLRDPCYADRAAKLKLRWQHADKPKLLMLGSSRTWFGFDALAMDRYCAFNFGLPAAGPLTERLVLERLLNDGLKPDMLVVEVMPALMAHTGAGPEELRFRHGDTLAWCEVKHFDHRLRGEWQNARLQPWLGIRHQLLGRVCENALPAPQRHDAGRGVDAGGRICPSKASVSESERAKNLERDRRDYAAALNAEPCAESVQALHDIAAICEREGIVCRFVRMPEASSFRAMVRESILVPIAAIDATMWMNDADFLDGHHLLDGGASRFTARLAEAIQ